MTILFINKIASWMKQMRVGGDNTDNPEAVTNLLVDMLIAHVKDRRKGSGLIARANRFKKSAWIIRKKELPRLYLLFEQYLVEVDSGNISRSELRQKVVDIYGELLKIQAFGLIFEPLDNQRKLLCKYMLSEILSGVRASFVHGLSGIINELRTWMKTNGYDHHSKNPAILSNFNSSSQIFPEERLRFTNMALFKLFSSRLGDEQTKKIYTQAYEHTARIFKDLDAFPVVIDMLPEIMLDDDKISLLSRKQIQSVLHDKVDNLQKVNDALSKEISERNKITIQLRESQHFLSSLVNSSMDAVVAMNERGEITEWNNQAKSFFGWTKEEILGKVISATILPEKDQKSHIKWFKKYLSSGQSSFINRRFEFTCIRKDGSLFDAECCIAPMAQEEERFFSVFIRDITTRKEYEKTLRLAKDQAESAVRAKSEFLAVMSHEIRTPLNGVLGMTQMLRETNLNTEQSKYVNMINTSGNNLNLIINDILDLSKIEVGKMDLEYQPFNFSESLVGHLDLFIPRAREKNIDMHFYSDPKIPYRLLGDSTRIGQIIINLLSNAIKFTEVGSVSLRAELTSHTAQFSTIQVSITDSGIGIAGENQQDIFNAFSQEDSSTSRKFGGTGLGLTICLKLAVLMGGKIWVDSVEGEGSTFTLSLHLEHEKSNPECPLDGRNHSEFGVAILVEEEITRKNIVSYLSSAEIKHVTCGGASDLIDGLHDKLFTHVLIDDEAIKIHKSAINSNSNKLENVRLIFIDKKSKTNKFQIGNAINNLSMLSFPTTPQGFFLALDENTKEENHVPEERVLDNTFALQHPLNILVAEDNMINQALIGSILTKLGYNADFVQNGVDACSKCGQKAYDLVFMDVQMPEMDGITATAVIKETLGEHAPRIIALTANTSIGKDSNEKLEFDDFLSKPFQFKDFLMRLEQAHKLSKGKVKNT